MRVLADLDPHRLEAALLDTVARLTDATPARRVVVLVPTARLARHVERRLAERRDAWLGVEVLHLRAAAMRIIELDGPPPTTLSPRLLDRVLGSLLRPRRDGRWPEVVRRRPGALPRLRASLTDLREAGVAPEALASEAHGADEAELASLYDAYVAALDSLEASGLPDEPALTRRAVAGVPTWIAPGAAAVLYGTYELNGIQLDLVRAIDAVAETVAFVPCRPGAVASRFAERWATTHLDDTIEPADPGAAGGCNLSLDTMFDEPSRPDPAPAERIGLRHAQGEAAELRAALRDALAAVGEGCPAREVAVIARSLSPYASAVEAVVEEIGVPVASALSGALRRQPLVRDALSLLHVLGEGFPRRETVELLASPRIRWCSLADLETGPAGDCAERWSRAARIIGGREGWSAQLQTWLEQRLARRRHPEDTQARQREQAATIARCVEALDAAIPRNDAPWTEHAANFADLFERALGEPRRDDPQRAISSLGGLLSEMSVLDRLPGAARAVSFNEARSWLDSAVDGTTVATRDDERGIRILDAMQARGMTFRRVALVGLNTGRFPQQGAEDPILGDDLRRRLIESTGRPLPLAHSRIDEERLLLALTIGAGADRLDVSWQRAAESGRSRTPSLALREVARLKFGQPDVAPLDEERAHHPSHPEQVLDRFLERPGLLSPEEAVLLDALRLRDVDQIGRLADVYPQLRAGLRTLLATQAFVPSSESGSFDGRVGVGADATPSVSALEKLGRCPLQYFFSRVLGVDEPEDEPDELELSQRDLGTAIHDLLEGVYGDVAKSDGFEGEPADVEASALAALALRRDSILGAAGEPIRARAPRLWAHLTRRWYGAVATMIRADVRRLCGQGFVSAGFEKSIEADVELGEGVRLQLRGRIDRRLRSDDRDLISDYKISHSLDRRVNRTQALKGRELQVALYAMMLDWSPEIELIGVHPDLADDELIREFPGFDDVQQTSFKHTMRVLVALDRDGVFPLSKGKQCDYCAYTGACRRNHPPTAHREELAPDTVPFRSLERKSTRTPMPPKDDAS